MEDVFLTHLEMEFPEFRQISASIKGKFGIQIYCSNVLFNVHVFICTALHLFVCTSACNLTWLSVKQKNQRRTQGRHAELLSQ